MMDSGYDSTILQYLCGVLILLTKIQSDLGIIFWEAGRMPGSQSMTAMPQPKIQHMPLGDQLIINDCQKNYHHLTPSCHHHKDLPCPLKILLSNLAGITIYSKKKNYHNHKGVLHEF